MRPSVRASRVRMMLKHSIRIYPQVVGRIVVLVVLTLGFVQALCHVAASFDDTGHVTMAREVVEHSGVTRDFEVSGDTGASWSAGYAGHSEGAGDSGAAGHTEIAGRSEGTGHTEVTGHTEASDHSGVAGGSEVTDHSGISGHSGVAGHSGNTDAPRCDQGSGEHCGPSDLATSCLIVLFLAAGLLLPTQSWQDTRTLRRENTESAPFIVEVHSAPDLHALGISRT